MKELFDGEPFCVAGHEGVLRIVYDIVTDTLRLEVVKDARERGLVSYAEQQRLRAQAQPREGKG